jgi:hypothetical protein
MAGNAVADIVYNMSFQARTGMGDALDYNVVIEVMNQLSINGQDRLDIIQKIMVAEQTVKGQMKKNQDSEKKNG